MQPMLKKVGEHTLYCIGDQVKEFQLNFFSCSIWHTWFWGTALNWFTQLLLKMFTISWLRVLIFVVIFRLNCDRLGTTIQYTHSFSSPERKCPVGVSQVMLLTNPLDAPFKSMNLEILHKIEDQWSLWCEEELHMAENQIAIEIFELLAWCKCPPFDNHWFHWMLHHLSNIDIPHY